MRSRRPLRRLPTPRAVGEVHVRGTAAPISSPGSRLGGDRTTATVRAGMLRQRESAAAWGDLDAPGVHRRLVGDRVEYLRDGRDRGLVPATMYACASDRPCIHGPGPRRSRRDPARRMQPSRTATHRLFTDIQTSAPGPRGRRPGRERRCLSLPISRLVIRNSLPSSSGPLRPVPPDDGRSPGPSRPACSPRNPRQLGAAHGDSAPCAGFTLGRPPHLLPRGKAVVRGRRRLVAVTDTRTPAVVRACLSDRTGLTTMASGGDAPSSRYQLRQPATQTVFSTAPLWRLRACSIASRFARPRGVRPTGGAPGAHDVANCTLPPRSARSCRRGRSAR